MDPWDLALILFGASMACAFGELRAYFDRKEQRTIREEDRTAHIAEATAERHRALNMTTIDATRKTVEVSDVAPIDNDLNTVHAHAAQAKPIGPTLQRSAGL